MKVIMETVITLIETIAITVLITTDKRKIM